MAVPGTAHMYARLSDAGSTGTGRNAKMRLNASRLGYHGPQVALSIAGTARHGNVDRLSISISERIDQKSASFEVFGFTPAYDDEVIIGAGSLSNVLFRGVVTGISQTRFKLDQGRVVQSIVASGLEYKLNAAYVTKLYATQSATAILEDLVSTYASGFTSAAQQALASIEIPFTFTRVGDAIQRLADRVGAKWYVDDDKVVHFFTTTDRQQTQPQTINSSNRHVRFGRHGGGSSDIANRIFVEGLGTAVRETVAVGQTTMALDDATMFSALGGVIKAAYSQIITYAAASAGGGDGSTAANNLAAPGSAPSVAEGGVAGNLAGSYKYKVTFANATGETAASSASSAVTPDAAAAPTGSWSAAASSTEWGGLAIGASNYDYRLTFISALGETTIGSGGVDNYSGTTIRPSVLLSTPTETTGGSMALGQYFYQHTFRTPHGETLESTGGTPVNQTVTGSNNAISFSAAQIPDPPTGAVVAIYRTVVGGSSAGPFYAVGAASGTAPFKDTIADANLGQALPQEDTAGAFAVNLSGIETGPSGTIARAVYRTKTGGSAVYFLVGVIPGNATTTLTDNVSDASLGYGPPLTNTAGGETVSLSSIPTGGAAIVSRRLYRTKAGGTAYHFLDEINDNSTTTYTDDVPDTSLGGLAPTQSTIAANIGDTSLRVLETGNFLAGGGWIEVGQQRITYTGRSASSGEGTLTGIPATGPGAITSGITAGDSIVPIGFISGIPSSGTGSVLTQLEDGDEVNLLVQDDDATSQAAYGVREFYIQDRRLSEQGATDRAAAELSLRKDPVVSGDFVSTDPNVRAGRTVTYDIYGLSETRTIHGVEIGYGEGPLPLRRAHVESRSPRDLYTELRALRDQVQGQ